MYAIRIEEHAGMARRDEAIRVGVPLPRGRLANENDLHVVDDGGRVLKHQAKVLARWPDRSIQWLLLDTCVDVDAGSSPTLMLRTGARSPSAAGHLLECTESGNSIAIASKEVTFLVPRSGSGILRASSSSCGPFLSGDGLTLQLVDSSGHRFSGVIDAAVLEEKGPVRASVRLDGRFTAVGRSLEPLRFSIRCKFFADNSTVVLDVTITNTGAARHPGNLWDLGDKGSCHFRELSIEFGLQARPVRLQWYTDANSAAAEQERQPWRVYQNSSGGPNWDSMNHIDARGDRTVRFRGYRVLGPNDEILHEGLRAEPVLNVTTADSHASASVRWFWQNFPTSLEMRSDRMRIGLFPEDPAKVHELQGGERKRQTVWLHLGPGQDGSSVLRSLQQPLHIRPDFAMCKASGAVPYLAELADRAYSDYVDSIASGPASFFENREKIDEYGWRNFGDLYADHEAVNSPEGKPLISHYNNQYDFIYAAGLHYLRTGDACWLQLMEESAGHTMDIDIYHTQEDRPAYNGGLFWHTDHYRDAATATHRTYSRTNYDGASYGGGPGNEHNYTSGLLLYYYLSGDLEARKAVLQLADWVVAMDDGARTVLSIFNSRPTGLASCTVDPAFHGPGRGAGNSINALLDAYALCGDRSYMNKAEELLRRCIHPEDDIDALGLHDPEYRWSYLVFLQVLGKYLDAKGELGEFDFYFHYARDSLLHYADWMLENEVPYKDVLHKVKLPTETWPAQDIRKCHVMHLAARHCGDNREELFSRKANYFHARCIEDLLAFETADLTRPRVIIAVHALINDYFSNSVPARNRYSGAMQHNYRFGSPRRFEPQRALLSQTMWNTLRLITLETRRVLRDVGARLKLSIRSPRQERG